MNSPWGNRTLKCSYGGVRAALCHDVPGNQATTPSALSSLLDKAQRWTASLRLWWRRRKDNASFEQDLPYFLPYDIADPDGGDVACEQFDGVRSRPFALFVGTLAA